MKSYLRFAAALTTLVVMVGILSYLFLMGLEWVTNTRIHDPRFLLFAPVAGALTGFLYVKVSPKSSDGNSKLFRILRSEKKSDQGESVPFLMPPLIILSTWVSHLVGLSVGREGTAVQAGGGLAMMSARIFSIDSPERKRFLLRIGLAAGFASVFGVPLAGAVFAFEVSGFKKTMSAVIKRPQRKILHFLFAFGTVFLSASAADFLTRFLGATHDEFPKFILRDFFSPVGLFAFVAGSLVFGVLALFYLHAFARFRSFWAKAITSELWRPVVGGAIFTSVFFMPLWLHKYIGLGANVIHESFRSYQNIHDSLLKIVFTVFSIGTGFRGGEVTPLFFIGATAGSALSQVFALPPQALASLGLVAVFGAAAGVPVSCAVMAAELFGPATIFLSLPACMIASRFCRQVSLYGEES